MPCAMLLALTTQVAAGRLESTHGLPRVLRRLDPRVSFEEGVRSTEPCFRGYG